MKKLIIINGAMGVGKSVICKALNKRLYNSVWLDGDWCMMINPMNFDRTNTLMFLDNAQHMMNNFLSNPAFEYILFSWVFPREDLANYLIGKLASREFDLKKITLTCANETLRQRMSEAGRDPYTIERSLTYQQAFTGFDTIKLDTTEMTVGETLDKVLEIIGA